MIAFCTHCFVEIDSEDQFCPYCEADLSTDARSYEDKLMAALEHPLPEARARICWLVGENNIRSAAPKLMQAAANDPDLFVRKSAIEALAVLRDPRSYSLLQQISEGGNRFLGSAAKNILDDIESTKGSLP